MSVKLQSSPLLQRVKRNGWQEEENRAEAETARPYKSQGKPEVIKVVSEWSNDDRKVPANQVHAEQEEGNAGGPNLGVDNLYDDGEEDSEPGRGKKIVGYQGEHGARRVEEKGESGQRRG